MILQVDRGADVHRLVRLLRIDDTLLFAAAGALEKGLSGQIQVLERLGVLFAGQIAALEIKESIDCDIDDIFHAATIYSDFVRMSVLEHDLDEGANH